MNERLQPPEREYTPHPLETDFDAAVYPHLENYGELSLQELETLTNALANIYFDIEKLYGALERHRSAMGGEDPTFDQLDYDLRAFFIEQNERNRTDEPDAE